MKYCIRRDFRNKWRWYLETADGKRLATGESYKTREECENVMAQVRQSSLVIVEDAVGINVNAEAGTRPSSASGSDHGGQRELLAEGACPV